MTRCQEEAESAVLEAMKEQVCAANRWLHTAGLVVLTWGNVSAIDRAQGLVVIKPSGVPYERMSPEDMVVVNLKGDPIEGRWRPSSDTAAHLELYRAFSEIGGITHTHSRWATLFAQAQRPIPMLGTTHADTFYRDIPCTRPMTPAEIAGDYERETGRVIVEACRKHYRDTPAVLVRSHGPFTWGADGQSAAENALVLEEVAMMAWHTMQMTTSVSLQPELSDRHYLRKHGVHAYYGQKGENHDL